MNQENQNNVNNSQNNNTVPTTPVVDKFMRVDDINKINEPVMQQPTVVATEPPKIEPINIPVVDPMNVSVPSTEPQSVEPVEVQSQQQVEPRVLESTVAGSQVQTSVPTEDNNSMVNEKLKKVEIKDYTPPSKSKVILLIVSFILLVIFVLFLPEISNMLRNNGSSINYEKEKNITTGKLICTLDTNTEELDKNYELTFNFTDSKLTRDKFVVTTRGDSTTESSLDELNEKCNLLKNEVEGLEGVSVRCDYTEGRLVETQSFNLDTIDEEKLDSAFTEAGGMLLSYKINQNIDDIEKNMKATGYTCERQ